MAWCVAGKSLDELSKKSMILEFGRGKRVVLVFPNHTQHQL